MDTPDDRYLIFSVGGVPEYVSLYSQHLNLKGDVASFPLVLAKSSVAVAFSFVSHLRRKS